MKHKLLHDLYACAEAISFCENFPDLDSAWIACQRGDWMLWFAERCGVDRKILIRIACDFARHAPERIMDQYVSTLIKTIERWTLRVANIDEVTKAQSNFKNLHGGDHNANYAANAIANVVYDGNASVSIATAAVCRLFTGYYDNLGKLREKLAFIVLKHIPTLPKMVRKEIDE